MKRVVVILLTVAYLFSSTGVSAKSMYCLGVLTSTSISYSDGIPHPCKKGMDMRKCCKTKKQYLKVKDQHYGSVTLAFLAKLFPVLSHYITTDIDVEQPCTANYHAYNSNAPPNAGKTPVYKLNCTYRI